MSPLNWTEVDGVPTVWVDTPGPLKAELIFGTGRAHETLPNSGHTHLIEHLALASSDITARQHNGFTGITLTGFTTIGQPGEVVSFFDELCRSLLALPEDRLQSEKDVLEAEQSTRGYDPSASLLSWRYGMRGYGMVAAPELGVAGATIEQLSAAVAQRFTRANAVLSLSGPPPAGLRLSLPDGPRQPQVREDALPSRYPCWVTDDMCGGVLASSITSRSAGSLLYGKVVTNRLQQDLRVSRALSYSPGFGYSPVAADRAWVFIHADSSEDNRTALTAAFGEFMQGLSAFTSEEVETARAQLAEEIRGVRAPAIDERLTIWASSAASNHALGRTFEEPEAIEEEVLSATVEDLERFHAEVLSQVIYALPTGVGSPEWAGYPLTDEFPKPVVGRTVAPRMPEKPSMTYGQDGVTLAAPNGMWGTVLYSELAAAEAFGDGPLVLHGIDGTTLTLNPSEFRGGTAALAEIRARLPRELVLAREWSAEDAKKERDRAKQQPSGEAPLWKRMLGTAMFVLGIATTAIWAAFLAISFQELFTGYSDIVEQIVVDTIMLLPLLVGVGFIVGGFRLRRR